MDYYQKYLKYKSKYLNLKKLLSDQSGGIDDDASSVGSDKKSLLATQYQDKTWDYFELSTSKDIRDKVIQELERRMNKNKLITPEQARIYFAALEGKFYRNKICESKVKSCPTDVANTVIMSKRLHSLIKNEALFKKSAPNLYQHIFVGRIPQTISGGGAGKTEVYLFKAEWCPHCVAFKSTWEKLQKELKNKYEFITVDSDKDKKVIEKWAIKGFPTIIKKVGENAKEYVGPRDEESVKKFIEEN